MVIDFDVLVGALLLRVGLAMYAGGSVRSKHVASILARHLLDLAIAVLAFWAVGAAIAYQKQTAFLGLLPDMLVGRGQTLGPALTAVCVIGATFIGTTAERSRMRMVLILSLVTAAVTLPMAWNWARYGWLSSMGFGAGGALVHVVGGTAALVAALFVGPRDGKYHRDGSTSLILGHHVPMLLIGSLLSLAGMILVTGQPAVLEFGAPKWVASGGQNILLGAAAATLAAAGYCQLILGKLDVPLLAAALIGGAIAASGGAAILAGWGAVLTGAVAGVLAAWSLIKLDLVLKLDDVTGAITVHGIAGALGILAATPVRELFWAERLKALGVQALGLLAIVALTALITAVTLKITATFGPLRVKDADEFDGLDLVEHDVTAYPDFQHSTIR